MAFNLPPKFRVAGKIREHSPRETRRPQQQPTFRVDGDHAPREVHPSDAERDCKKLLLERHDDEIDAPLVVDYDVFDFSECTAGLELDGGPDHSARLSDLRGS